MEGRRRDAAGSQLDFTKSFLPESPAGGAAIAKLSPVDRLRLNHTRANGYVHLFHYVEESIVAMVLKHVQGDLSGDDAAQRALLRFADEELKHQQLFKRFGQAFEAGFGSPCGRVATATSVARDILKKSPLSVTLITLHLELLTQRHCVDAFKVDADTLDPLFKSLFKHHWIEEAQHAKIDILEMQKLALSASPETIASAFTDYADICRAFASVLGAQAALDVDSFERSRGRALGADERTALVGDQGRAYREIFLVQGIRNPGFIERAAELAPSAPALLAELAAELAA